MSQTRLANRAVFIDGANVYASSKNLGFEMDYKKLLEWSTPLRAMYYTAVLEEEEYSSIRPLLDWLDYNGYNVVSKMAKKFVDSEGRTKIKGNMDMEMAVDMLELVHSGRVTEVILMTGDGDFRCLVESVQRLGCHVTVVSTIKTSPPMVADELRRQADRFLDMAEIANLIGKPRGPRVIRER